MALIQIIFIVFLFFALSRVILRFRGGQIRINEFLFWSAVFITAIFGVFVPEEFSRFARVLGIGRGVDLIIYVSIVILFYLVFRLYVLLEGVRHEITELVRKIALENNPKR